MRRSFSFLFALVLLGIAGTASAQTSSFADLAGDLKVGQKVVVTEANGEKTSGKVIDLTPTSLTLNLSDFRGRHTFDESRVATVRKTDSVWNGLLIGLGAGFLAAEIWRYDLCGPRGSDDECSAIVTAVGWVTMVPGGAVTGALIDKFTGNTVLYRAPGPRASLRVGPIVGHEKAGVGVSLRF